MVTVTKNAGTVASSTWTNPTNAQGAHDGNCATLLKSDNPTASYIATCTGFGFAIPAGSTLNSVKFGFHRYHGSAIPGGAALHCVMAYGDRSSTETSTIGAYTHVCADCVNQESMDVKDLLLLTVAILNAETFTFVFKLVTVAHAPPIPTNNCSVDNVWITVDYTAGGVAHTATVTEIFGALDSKTRVKTTHRTLTELFGALDAKSRAKSIHRTLTELFGALDTKARTKSIYRAFTELLGKLDTKTRVRSIKRAFTELLGASDSKTRLKTVHRTITELLGGLDAKTRVKQIHRTFTELLGGLDSRTRAKSIFRTITEKLGLSDSFSKTKGPISPYVDSGSPQPRKPLDLSIPEYGILVLLLRKLRLRRKLAVPAKPVATDAGIKQSIIAALLEEGMSEGEAEEKYKIQAVSEYMFVAVGDDATCENCMDHDGETYTLDEVDGLFPYAEEVNEELIMPMCHINCRCMLVLL